jgi:hypothetical protein
VEYDLIDLADRRTRGRPAVDWQLFTAFAEHVDLAGEVEADFKPRLISLDVELKAGNPTAARYWRLVEAELRRGLLATTCEASLDRIVVVAALLLHWEARHGA